MISTWTILSTQQRNVCCGGFMVTLPPRWHDFKVGIVKHTKQRDSKYRHIACKITVCAPAWRFCGEHVPNKLFPENTFVYWQKQECYVVCPHPLHLPHVYQRASRNRQPPTSWQVGGAPFFGKCRLFPQCTNMGNFSGHFWERMTGLCIFRFFARVARKSRICSHISPRIVYIPSYSQRPFLGRTGYFPKFLAEMEGNWTGRSLILPNPTWNTLGCTRFRSNLYLGFV